MSCQRTLDIDLAAYLVDPRDEAWAEFRSHFLACHDCTRELERWTELEVALRRVLPMADEHPEPEVLALFAEAREQLEVGVAQQVVRHLENCPACKTDVAAMSSFDFSAAARLAEESASEGGASRAKAAENESRGLVAVLGSWFAGPPAAIPVAIAAALLLWLSFGGEGNRPTSPDGPPPPRLANEEPPEPIHPIPAPEITPPSTLDPPESVDSRNLAQASDSAPVSPPNETPEFETLRPRPVRPEVAPERPSLAQSPPESATEENEVMLLAAMVELGNPSYALPDPMDGLPYYEHANRSYVTRSGGQDRLEIKAISPKHAGRTTSASPALWWHLSENSNHPIRFRLIGQNPADPGSDVALDLELDAPVAAGFHRIDLEEFDVELVEGRLYEWSVAAVVDRDRPMMGSRSIGALVRVPEASAPATSGAIESGHEYARAGLWYDAFDRISTWAERYPEEDALKQQRAVLLASAGIDLSVR